MTLKIEENDKHKTIPEAFGMSEKRFDELQESMTKYFTERVIKENFCNHAHDKDGKCLKDTKAENTSKTAKLSQYLESKEFGKLKWKLESANDYFMLGFIFTASIRMAEKLAKQYVMEEIGDELPGILGKILGGGISGHKIEVTIKK